MNFITGSAANSKPLVDAKRRETEFTKQSMRYEYANMKPKALKLVCDLVGVTPQAIAEKAQVSPQAVSKAFAAEESDSKAIKAARELAQIKLFDAKARDDVKRAQMALGSFLEGIL